MVDDVMGRDQRGIEDKMMSQPNKVPWYHISAYLAIFQILPLSKKSLLL
jgi:hypothetical protein